METKRRKRTGLLLCLAVLLAMLVFYEKAHPLVILDADDWTYIAQSRVALPTARLWNPARILPEILMPYAVSLGVKLLSPLGYIPSITATNGLVLSLFITVYVYAFYRLLTDRVRLPAGRAALLSLLFLLLHFTIFRRENAQNTYLFWSKDVTCIYYYVIPALLNCSLVMFLARTDLHRRFWEKTELPAKSLLLLACYLAVFSNLFESGILACWCGLELLAALLRRRRQRLAWRQLWKEQSFSLGLLLLWLVSAWFESRGARAAASGSRAFGAALKESFGLALSAFGGIYALVLLLMAGALGGLLLALLLRRLSEEGKALSRSLLLPLLFLAVLLLLFEALLCAKVDPAYARRSDVLFGCFFVLLALAVLALALLLKRWERLLLVLPLLLLVLFSVTDTWGRTFLDCNDILAPAELCTALDQSVVDQVLAAQERGETRVTVKVLDLGGGDNWPQTLYMGNRVAVSLYKHGVTQRLMEIEIQPDKSVNARFHAFEDFSP